MRGLRVWLLGRPRLELDGQALTALMPLKQQALVYVLAADQRPLARGRAAALLWGGHDEAAARANLRVALSQLRRWLPALLQIDHRDIAFAAGAPVQVDLVDLQAAADDGQAPIERRAEAAAAWRGPLLDGFELPDADEFGQWVQPLRQRAADAATRLMARLAADCAAAGDLDAAIGHCRARLRVDEADEAAHMDLMRWLAARGQRTAALAQYENCRAALRDRLGARPSADCYALYTRIHADAPVPALPPTPPEPGPVAAAASALAPLVGRDAELALLEERLTDPGCRWLTLLGPGGIGKTTLAAAAAAALEGRFRHGTLWLGGRDDGDALRDADAVLRRVIERCGADREAPRAQLLVLDNLETVPAGAARELIEQIDRRAPGVVVLATSRQRLADAREWLLELSGLSLERSAPEAVASSPAARLFVEAARRGAPGFDPMAEAGAIERLVRRLGGLPLALELAGRAAQRLGVEALDTQASAGGDSGLDAVFDDSWRQLDPALREAALRLALLPAEADLELAHEVGVAAGTLHALRDRSWLSRGEGGRLSMHPLQQDFVRRRPEAADRAGPLRERLASALAARLPAVEPFAAGPAWTEAQRSAARSLAATALARGAAVAAAAEVWLAADPPPLLQARVDATVAVLVAADRGPEAIALLGQVVQRTDLPTALAAAWRLRQAELRVACGESPGTLELLLVPLAELGLGGIRPDVAPRPASFAAAMAQAARARGRFDDPVSRRALARLVHRCLMLLGQLLSFSPAPRGIGRACVLGGLVAGPAGESRRALQVMLAYGSLFHGAAGVSRRLATSPARRPRFPSSPAMDTHLATGVAVTAMALGRWAGLDAELAAIAAACAAIGHRRGEMEARSLRGKFAFYEGRLADAVRLMGEVDAQAQQHPGAAWMAWGATGLAETAWALGPRDDGTMQALVDRVSRAMTESENIDNAYTLRRLGLVARLAWRRGDLATARDAVGAAVAAMAHAPRRGFWAHEGYAGIGEVLLAWAAHERRVGGALPPLQRLWAEFDRSLRGHGQRFPAGAALVHRLQGQWAAFHGDTAAARRRLARGLAAAERQGLRVELARCCEALAVLDASEPYSQRARALWHDMGAGVG